MSPARRTRVPLATLSFSALATWLSGCAPDQPPAGLDELRLPTGMAAVGDGRWLLVSNGNWDLGRRSSAIVMLDMDRLEGALRDPLVSGAATTGARPCRVRANERAVECRADAFIDESRTVRIPSGAGNIAVDRQLEDEGRVRLLVPTRIETGVWWIDVVGPGADARPELRCGQGDSRACGADYAVPGIPDQPARISIDGAGFPYAYLPHLLDRRMTLLRLRGERGPEVADVEEEFFRVDPLFDADLGGGFSVVTRPCDVNAANVPSETVDCRRPLLYGTQRFWFGIRTFRVAPGLDVVLPGAEFSVPAASPELADGRPLMADLDFIDPVEGDELLVVQTTPPALALVDTSLDEEGAPRNRTVRSIPLCANPNILAVHRPEDGPWLGFVSCRGDDRVQVVDLAALEVIRSIPVGRGPNELLVDEGNARLFVANTDESTISIIDLERGSLDYLTEVAIVGLGGRKRTP